MPAKKPDIKVKFLRNYTPRKKGEVVELESRLADWYISNGIAVVYKCDGECDDADHPCVDCGGGEKKPKTTRNSMSSANSFFADTNDHDGKQDETGQINENNDSGKPADTADEADGNEQEEVILGGVNLEVIKMRGRKPGDIFKTDETTAENLVKDGKAKYLKTTK